MDAINNVVTLWINTRTPILNELQTTLAKVWRLTIMFQPICSAIKN